MFETAETPLPQRHFEFEHKIKIDNFMLLVGTRQLLTAGESGNVLAFVILVM